MNWIRAFCLLLLLLALTAAMAACLPFEAVRSPLDRLSGDGSADAYSIAVHRRFQLAGGVLAGVLLLTAGVLWRRREAAARRLDRQASARRGEWRELRDASVRACRQHGPALALLILVGVAVRWSHLHQPLSYDEAYTYVNYARWPLPLVIARYKDPNNHVFHSVLVHLVSRLIGDSPWMLRLPALLFGLATPVLTYLLASRLSRWVALAAGLMTAVSPQLVFYSVNARGYTLATTLFLLTCLATPFALRGNRVAAGGVIVALALSIWTLPTMVYALIGWLAWSLATPRDAGLIGGVENGAATTPDASATGTVRWPALGWIALLTVAAAATLYLPIVLAEGWRQLRTVGGSYSKPLGLWLADAPLALGRVVTWASWKTPWPAQLVLVLGLLLSLLRPATRPLMIRGAAAMLALALVLLVQRTEPPERVWIFAVPLVLTAAARGYHFGPQPLDARLRTISAALVVTVLCGYAILTSGPVLWSPETAIFPEAEQVTRKLQTLAQPAEPIVLVTPSSGPVLYHARRIGLDPAHFMPPQARVTNNRSALLVTSRHFDQTPEDVLAELKLLELFDPARARAVVRFRTATIYRVPGR